MQTHNQVLWMTLFGLSLLFVGGFVLWVYGSKRRTQTVIDMTGPEAEAARKLHGDFVQWFLLYGGAAMFTGIGCLLTALMIIL
jgi:hypothetical protein